MALLDLVSSGDLRMADAMRIAYPEEKAVIENMELREMFDHQRDSQLNQATRG
jgi:hypothetical protein